MLQELIVLASTAAEEEETSKLPFYVLGSALALWGIAVAAFGISRRQAFPATTRARNLVMLVTGLLMVAACGSAVITG